MEIEEVKSLKTMVGQILGNMKETVNTKPATRIGQSSIDTFNNILRQAKSIGELKGNPVIGGMMSMSIPASLEEVALKAPKVLDLVTNLSAIHGALMEYMRKHQPPPGRKEIREI